MNSSPLNLKALLKPLFMMCFVLLLTPNLVAFACLCLLSQVAIATALASLVSFSASPEIGAAALLAIGTGMFVYLVVTILSREIPTLTDIVALELSQAASFFMSVAALVHNSQEEFCRANSVASALSKAFQLDSCSLTIDFWMQVGMSGLISAISFVLILRIARSIIRTLSN